MADRVITAEALITAKDGTGDVFSKIGAKLQNIGHSAKSSKAVGDLCDQLDAAARRMKALDKLQANMAGFAKARTAFNESKVALEAHARAMKSAEKPTAEMERKYAQLQTVVQRAAAAFEKQKAAMIETKRAAEQFGAPVTKIAAEQARLRSVIEQTTHAIERQTLAENEAAKAAHKNAAAQGHVDRAEAHRSHNGFGSGVAHGVGHLSGVTGLIGGYGVVQAAEHAAETYREFDKERRYQKAVMGLTDEQQEPLIKQAIEGGATSRYNDIQWLESQRELAARGLNRDQVLAIAKVAANLGQAMDKSLPEASRALEGGMFGFGKDTSTYEKALANAKRTADLQVKASKISGMNYEDVVQAYKYGAAPFRMAGLSEEQLLAFAAIGKKANMGGDEMGVAARALVANLLKPTAGARTAMLANGVDFSKYQRLGQMPMDVSAFSKSIAQSYGVQLDEKAQGALKQIFQNRAVVADASKFMPAVVRVLSDTLGGDDAKSKNKIAGEARRYRDAAMEGVDAHSLFRDLMPVVAKNPALANLLFGSKQGARIRTAIGDPEVFLHKLDQLENHSSGYAENIAGQRMAGYDGAMFRLTGAIANLQTAFGRAFDNGGKGGLLTAGTNAIAGGMQAFVDAPVALQRLAFSATAAAAAFAGFKSFQMLSGGFGLGASATALDGSAAALTGAAAAIEASAAGKGAAQAMPHETPNPGPAAASKAEAAAGAVTGAETAAAAASGASLAARAKGALRGVLRTGARAVPEILMYEAGKDAIEGGLEYLPGPKEPAGYNAREKLHEGPLDRLKDIWRETAGARAWLHDSIMPSAHAEESPKPPLRPPRTAASTSVIQRSNDPFGGLAAARASFSVHPALQAPPQGNPLSSKLGPITAIVDKPVDVTGKVTAEVKGQANVTVAVKVTGPGEVTGQFASSSGNIKVSTGASMPGAKTAAAGSTGTK